MHLVGCLYYFYQWCTVKQISDNEIYLLIKYIKSVLWRVEKNLSYIEDARHLKVKPKVWTQVDVTFFVQNKPNHTREIISGKQGLQPYV